MKKNKGIALISVFWTMIILSVIALSVLSIGKTQIKLSNNIYQYSQIEYSAEAGINYIISQLASRNAVRNIPNGISNQKYKFSENFIELDIIPEEGKIDLNTSDPLMISALLAYYGVPENEAIDIEENIRIKRNMASDNLFYTVDEVKKLVDFPEEKLECILPYLTVYSQRSGVDMNLASNDMNSFVNWADTQRWGGKNWFNTDGGSTGGMVSGKNSIMQNIRSYSGRAFMIISTVNLKNNIKIQKKAVVRITGNMREPYWAYLWETNYVNDNNDCVHL